MSTRRGRRAATRGPGAAGLAIALAALAAAASSAGPLGGAGEIARASSIRPNVVVLMTDDQTEASLRFMPGVRSLLAKRGARFPESFVSFPLCCPSRATFLTGRYAHNHGVRDNVAPEGGFDRLDSSDTLAVWLEQAGYYTGLVGKYLNGYEQHRDDVPPLVPPGWTEWHGSTITDNYYGYELNENFWGGRLRDHGTLLGYGEAPQYYSTDLFTQKAVDFIERRAPAAQPFFLWVAYFAPHGGGPNPNPNPPGDCDGTAKPAPRHGDAFNAEPLPLPPSFGEADVSDKPGDIQSQPRLTDEDIARIRRHYRCRLESLLAVDESVQGIVQALRVVGELGNSLIVFTSDNAFLQGEHRVEEKARLYEEAVRVPLAIRGPGIPAGVTVRDMTVNPDLTATILDAARVAPGLPQDGRTLLPFVARPSVERGRALLLENRTSQAILTHRYVYAEHASGERELYDLAIDPYQLESLHTSPAYAGVRNLLAGELDELRDCTGAACRTTPDLSFSVTGRPGPGCVSRPVIAALRGPDAGSVASVRFYTGASLVGVDRSRPFEMTIPYRLLSARRATRVRQVASLHDGRRVATYRSVRACG